MTESAGFAALLADEAVEERSVLRSRFGFLAIHGGLEGGTDVIATAAATAAGASLYALVQPPGAAIHIPSTQLRPELSPTLAAFVDHVDVVISIHGYGRWTKPVDLLLGGTNRALAADLAAALGHHLPGFVSVTDLDAIEPGLRGLHPRNPVNLPRHGGVQLELPHRARGSSPRPEHKLRPCIPVPGLIEALATTARTFQSTSKVPPERQ